jgi:hypothetical protein
MNKELSMNDIQEPITSALPEVIQIIERVLQAEKDKLYMKFPRNILSLAKTTTSIQSKVFTL